MVTAKVVVVPSLTLRTDVIKADCSTNFNPTVEDAWMASDTLLLADTCNDNAFVCSDTLSQLLDPFMLDR